MAPRLWDDVVGVVLQMVAYLAPEHRCGEPLLLELAVHRLRDMAKLLRHGLTVESGGRGELEAPANDAVRKSLFTSGS